MPQESRHRIRVDTLQSTPLRRHLTDFMYPNGRDAAGLSKGEATKLLVSIHNEAIEVFHSRLCEFYEQSWNDYRLDAHATEPGSKARVRELCETIMRDVRACMVIERVSS